MSWLAKPEPQKTVEPFKLKTVASCAVYHSPPIKNHSCTLAACFYCWCTAREAMNWSKLLIVACAACYVVQWAEAGVDVEILKQGGLKKRGGPAGRPDLLSTNDPHRPRCLANRHNSGCFGFTHQRHLSLLVATSYRQTNSDCCRCCTGHDSLMLLGRTRRWDSPAPVG